MHRFLHSFDGRVWHIPSVLGYVSHEAPYAESADILWKRLKNAQWGSEDS